MLLWKSAFFGASLFLATALSAQTATPTQKQITVTFTGVVENGPDQSIMIRQPDGSLVPFTGPVPDYPYRTGDNVTVSFTTTVPTAGYYELNPAAKSVDGIYRIGVYGPANGPASSPFGYTTNLDASGPLGPTQNLGQAYGTNGITIVYNANNDQYSLELPSGSWTAGVFDLPSFYYDAATGQLSLAPSSCYFGARSGCDVVGIGGVSIGSTDLNTVSTSNVPIWTSQAPSSQQPSILGYFKLGLSGSWNIPSYGSEPIDVPEPSTLLLFGFGAGGMVWRKRRAKRS